MFTGAEVGPRLRTLLLPMVTAATWYRVPGRNFYLQKLLAYLGLKYASKNYISRVESDITSVRMLTYLHI